MKKETIDLINKFNDERDWHQFHTGETLAKSLVIEATELLELYQWDQEPDKEEVAKELADCLVYSILLSEKYGFDIDEIIKRKMDENAEKYPVDKAKGNAKKYSDL